MARAGSGEQRLLFTHATLLKGNLVLMDRETESWWLQNDGRSIAGARKGSRLPPLPFTLTSWQEWHRLHPETTVATP